MAVPVVLVLQPVVLVVPMFVEVEVAMRWIPGV